MREWGRLCACSLPVAPGLLPEDAASPVGPWLPALHTLHEAAGEEGHGHEQDDGTADNGGDHSHLEAKGLIGWHGCEGDKTAPGCSPRPFNGQDRPPHSEHDPQGWQEVLVAKERVCANCQRRLPPRRDV